MAGGFPLLPCLITSFGMPIEIRELVIKVTVQDKAAGPAATPATPPPAELRQWQQELARTCVQQVLAELQRQRER